METPISELAKFLQSSLVSLTKQVWSFSLQRHAETLPTLKVDVGSVLLYGNARRTSGHIVLRSLKAPAVLEKRYCVSASAMLFIYTVDVRTYCSRLLEGAVLEKRYCVSASTMSFIYSVEVCMLLICTVELCKLFIYAVEVCLLVTTNFVCMLFIYTVEVCL